MCIQEKKLKLRRHLVAETCCELSREGRCEMESLLLGREEGGLCPQQTLSWVHGWCHTTHTSGPQCVGL